jgi:hypothetical protein
MEGGLAEADILTGDVNPCGHLADTFAKTLEDYPSTAGFHESADYVNYTEDIYVGYRYFETIPGAKDRVSYPFGYGLSYSEFLIRPVYCQKAGDEIVLRGSRLLAAAADAPTAFALALEGFEELGDCETCVILRGADVPEEDEQPLLDAIAEKPPCSRQPSSTAASRSTTG